MSDDTLYSKVVSVTSFYLGPAADRFVSRNIVNHLKKSPDKLTRSDLTELINWIKPAMGVLTEDTSLVDSYIEQLSDLGRSRGKTS